jgi:hypothetical protein
MDNQLKTQPETYISPVSPTEPKTAKLKKSLKPSSHLAILTLGFVVFLLLLAATSYLYWQNQQLKKLAIIPQPYPIEARPTSTPTIDPTASWQTFTGANFTIKYPTEYKVEERAKGFYMITATNEAVTQAGIIIDSRPSNFYTDELSAINHVQKSLTNAQTSKLGKWTIISGNSKQSMNQGLKFIKAVNSIDSIVVLAETRDLEPYNQVFSQILSTFKFTDGTNTNPSPTSILPFTCPENGWVDCMPKVGDEEQRQCTTEAIKWFEANCPNFQGVAQ